MLDGIISKETLGIIAVLLTLIGYAQYFRSMFQGRTKPHMFSWLIWTILTAIAFFAQITDGAGAGSWVTAVTAIISSIIVVYAYFYGEKEITKSDWFSFLTALMAIPIWLITDSPFWSVIIITIIDALGFYPTFRKSWHKPYEENMFHSGMAGIKFLLAVLALSNFSVITALYPISLVLANLVFVIFLGWRRLNLQPEWKKNDS